MAFTRSDRRLILVTGGLLILAGLFFASVLVFATGGNTPTNKDAGPLFIGPTSDLKEKLALGSPLYFANPFGGNGFWLDREHGEFVALRIGLPGDASCHVVWRGRINTYVDCKGRHVTKDELARYPIDVGTQGNRKGAVYVDLKHRLPAPATG